jgi:hypothetical protein
MDEERLEPVRSQGLSVGNGVVVEVMGRLLQEKCCWSMEMKEDKKLSRRRG